MYNQPPPYSQPPVYQQPPTYQQPPAYTQPPAYPQLPANPQPYQQPQVYQPQTYAQPPIIQENSNEARDSEKKEKKNPPLTFLPIEWTCPNCDKKMTTKTTSGLKSSGYCWACILFPCCLCCIPFFLTRCFESKHFCTNCMSYLGTAENQ